MVEVKQAALEERLLPEQIDMYRITKSGKVIPSEGLEVDVYIRDVDVRYFTDLEVMLYIRENYGPRIGVMRDRNDQILPREYKTTKLLLGVVKEPPAEK